MKNKTFNTIFICFLTALLIFSVAMNYLLSEKSSDLENQIDKKNDIIKSLIASDSISGIATKNYAETIQKYTEDSVFIIGGKKVSSAEIVSYTNDILDKYNNLVRLYNELADKSYELSKQNREYRLIVKNAEEFGQTNIISYNNDTVVVESRMGKDSVSQVTLQKLRTELSKAQGDLSIKEAVLKYIRDRYGISYTIKNIDKSGFTISIPFNNADSGLLLLPEYGKKIKKGKTEDGITTWTIK